MAIGLANLCLKKAQAGDITAQDWTSFCSHPHSTGDNRQDLIFSIGPVGKQNTLINRWMESPELGFVFLKCIDQQAS